MARFSFRNLFVRNATQHSVKQPAEDVNNTKKIVAAIDSSDMGLRAYDNSNITYKNDLSEVDYDAILRDKQGNINNLYMLADYYTDADPIVHGINKHVYLPFASGEWYLTCDNEKTIDIFEDYYDKIRLSEFIDDILLQYFKYANVFVYIWNGVAVTLPPHKCKIANIQLDGTPVVDLNVQEIQYEFRQRTYSLLEQKGVTDELLEDVLEGYPPEVAEAIRAGKQYARLDPHNTFVIQGSKEGWQRYAVPWIASALQALAKKELINNYETALLNIGARAFVHVRYGDQTKGQDMLPDIEQLRAVRNIFANAMKGNPLAVTNSLAEASVIQADMNDLYQFPLYSQVNNDILAAGGIAGIIVNGDSEEGSTFASAQVSMQAAASRIEIARREFEDFMLKLNRRIVEDIRLVRTNNLKNIPEFHFKPLSLSGKKELREACEKLWQQGLVSTKTMMDAYGYALSKERKEREAEASNGTDEIMIPRDQKNEATQSNDEETNPVGRPAMTDEERTSDPENAIRSKQAKDAADGDVTEQDV